MKKNSKNRINDQTTRKTTEIQTTKKAKNRLLTIRQPIRSLTEPPALKYSHFTTKIILDNFNFRLLRELCDVRRK
jgi:hypothetical protein